MSNQEHSSKESGRDGLPDLSILADFQFGPSWARKGAETSARLPEGQRERRSDEGRGEPGGRRRFSEGERGGRRFQGGFRGERNERGERADRAPRRTDGRSFGRGRTEGRGGDRFNRSERPERPERTLPDPTPGLRVELRPADSVLNIFEQEIRKHKRAISAMELAKVVMAEKNRYDIVLMKQEDGPEMIVSKKGDGACWLERREALDYLFRAPWFSTYYEAVEEEVEAPKGAFTAIAKCGFSGQLIGPVNWHGYQLALQNLHRSRFSNMSFERYRSRVILEKSQEAVDAWLAQASHKTVWKPLREGAGETLLTDEKAVERDFDENHFDDAYSVETKVFLNGATPRQLLSPGLGAHMAILSDKTRRAPQMLIPNLCHGLARHRLAIFKWKGRHYTGVSRVRSIPADTVLADRMMAIVAWAKEHAGQTAEKMFAELSGVAGEDKEKNAEAYAPYVADMIWLMEQGFILVTSDNAVWFPKAQQAPAAGAETAEPVASGESPGAKRPSKSKGKTKKRAAATKGGKATPEDGAGTPESSPVPEPAAIECTDPATSGKAAALQPETAIESDTAPAISDASPAESDSSPAESESVPAESDATPPASATREACDAAAPARETDASGETAEPTAPTAEEVSAAPAAPAHDEAGEVRLSEEEPASRSSR